MARASEALGLLAASTAIHIDPVSLREEVGKLRVAALEHESAASERGDEILKLSETLFAQDIELPSKDPYLVGDIDAFAVSLVKKGLDLLLDFDDVPFEFQLWTCGQNALLMEDLSREDSGLF